MLQKLKSEGLFSDLKKSVSSTTASTFAGASTVESVMQSSTVNQKSPLPLTGKSKLCVIDEEVQIEDAAECDLDKDREQMSAIRKVS